MSEFICSAGPGDRPYEEAHDGFSIAAVVEGNFLYRADGGVALLHPGALLLGNHGGCFRCGHEHGAGDRCISFNFSPDYFAEIARTAAGASGFRFRAPMLPVGKRSTPLLALVQSIDENADRLRLEELATHLVERVLAALSERIPSPSLPSRLETRRIADVLRHIEANAAEPIDLAGLASLANVSKYHFLRMFRRVTGSTPYQCVLGARMRRAAARLARSSDPVTSIAFESGFGDLSTFNARFRGLFGVTPTAYRSSFAARRTGWEARATRPRRSR